MKEGVCRPIYKERKKQRKGLLMSNNTPVLKSVVDTMLPSRILYPYARKKDDI